MEFIKSVVSGFGFGVGVCGAIAILATVLRANSAKENRRTLESLLRLEDIHRDKVAEAKRLADAAEFWIERELAKDQAARQ